MNGLAFIRIEDREAYRAQTLWGLLFNASNLATLLHERGAREEYITRALLLASHLCKAIEQERLKPFKQQSKPHPQDPKPRADGNAGVADIFLSYSSADRGPAIEISNMLRDVGRTCFLAERSIEPGEYWGDRIRKALQSCKELWVLVSPDSLNSEWVKTELDIAWGLEKPRVPILYRCEPNDLPQRLTGVQWIGFHEVESLIARRNP
jgi:hypothetical protein